MKKLLLIFAATASMALTSCGGSASSESATASDEANVDSLATALEEGLNAAQDSASVVEIINSANENIKALEAKGDTAAVKAYKWKLQELFDKNKEKVQNMNLTEAISEIANVENLSKQATEALKADAQTAKDDAKEAAVNAVKSNETVKEAAQKVEETKQKVEDVKKAADDVKSAAESAKNAINAFKKK